MPANYPAANYSPRIKANYEGVSYDPADTTRVFAEDVQKLDAEVVAVETELGLLPKGAYADVKTRLDAMPALIKRNYIAGRFYLTTTWDTITAFLYEKTGTATAEMAFGGLKMYSGGTMGNYVKIKQSQYNGYVYNPRFSNAPAFETVPASWSYTSQIVYFGLGDKDTNFLGFKWVADQVYAIAIYTDPDTEEQVLVSQSLGAYWPSALRLYRCEFDGIDTAKFYIGGVLVYTMTGLSLMINGDFNDEATTIYIYAECGSSTGKRFGMQYFQVEFNG